VLKITHKTHLDHGLSSDIIGHVLRLYADKDEFFIHTITLPSGLGEVECALIGPITGHTQLTEATCSYQKRNGREWDSRMTAIPPTRSRQLTIIAGPSDDDECVAYTMYGGPCAPREPGDPSIANDPTLLAESKAFWSEHALSFYAKG